MSQKWVVYGVFWVVTMLWAPSFLWAQYKPPILGVWLTQKKEKNAKIEIAPCQKDNAKFCGKIVWLETPLTEDGKEKVDKNNPDLALREHKILGLPILRDFQEKLGEPDVWDNGTIYNPEDGKTYSCIIRRQRNDRGKEILFVRGYVGISWFGKTQTWVRSSLDHEEK